MSLLTRSKTVQRSKAATKPAGRAKKLGKLELTAKDIALDNAISTAAARRRAKGTALVLSDAEIARINGAFEPIAFHPVGTLPVTKRELALDALAGPDAAP